MKMDFVKWRATTKHVTRCDNIDNLKEQYLLDIKAAAEMESIPDHWLGSNRDQLCTSVRVEHGQRGVKTSWSHWTQGQETDHCCVCWIYEWWLFCLCNWFIGGKLSNNRIPWWLALDFSESDWCNESTMVDKIFLPYVNHKRKELVFNERHPALAIFDEFNGRTTDAIFNLLMANNVYYVPNCTDKLQPPDVSVNKPAKDFLSRPLCSSLYQCKHCQRHVQLLAWIVYLIF